jgi:hypothetical protein
MMKKGGDVALECVPGSSAKLVGPAGSILLPDDDEISRKLAMLFEGQCEGLGPTQAARKFGYFNRTSYHDVTQTIERCIHAQKSALKHFYFK